MNAQVDLNTLKIASPCPANWNQMKGDDRRRFCAECQLHVYNLAGLSNDEAQDVLGKASRGERVCMRLLRRADGTVVTKDCPVGLKLVRKMKMKAATLRLSIVSLLSTLLWLGAPLKKAQAQEGPEQRQMLMGKVMPTEPHFLMGDVAVPDSETTGGLRPPPDEAPPQDSDDNR